MTLNDIFLPFARQPVSRVTAGVLAEDLLFLSYVVLSSSCTFAFNTPGKGV
jgi:hypothetical protein